MNRLSSNQRAIRVTGIYLIFGLVWIFSSDQVLRHFVPAEVAEFDLSRYQTWKGWFFVGINAVMLFWLSRSSLIAQDSTLFKLAAAEKDYRELIMNVPVGIYHTDAQGDPVFLNAQAAELTGFGTPEEYAGKWLDRIHIEDRDRIAGAWQRAVEMGQQFHQEYRTGEPQGLVRWLVEVAYPELNDSGQLIGYLGTLTDISDLRVTQQIEHELQDRLQIAIESAHVGLWDLNIQTNEAWFSKEWKQQLGLKGDHVGKKLSEWQNRLHPADAEQASHALQRFIRHPENDLYNEFRLRHKDGSYRWILSQASIRYEDGIPSRILGTHIDITRTKEDEDKLRESRERVNHLLEASPTVLYATRIGKHHVSPNWISESITRLFGYTVEEALKPRWWLTHMHPEDHDNAILETQKLMGGQSIRHDYRFFAKNGQIHWIRDTVRLIGDETEQVREAIGSWTDITEQRQEEEQMRLYAAAFDSINEGIIVTDTDQKILSTNRAIEEILGYTAHDLLAKTPSVLNSGRHSDEFFAEMMNTLRSTGAWHGEIWNRHRDGSIKPQWLSISTVNADDNKPDKYVCIYTDISDLKETEAELKYLAHYDSLTGLPNRVLLGSHLEQSLAGVRGHQNKLAVLLIDLDDFKSINDSMGHTIGDELLVAVAERLGSRMRDGDTLARLGGDEFLLLAEHLKNTEQAGFVATDLLAILSTPFALSNSMDIYVEACIGIAMHPANGDTVEALMRNADTAMYRAKELGRNKFCFYQEEMGSAVIEQVELQTALRQGIEHNQLILQYQPKVSLSTGRMTGAEALVRWNRPGAGMIPPNRFIPIAEHSGLIVPIGEWVLRTACAQVRNWLDAGLTPIQVAVNVSARQFRAAGLLEFIKDTLTEFDIPPALLALEITETALMEDPDDVKEVLQELKELGLYIALDDFGTGFSNMAYLSRFSLDVLKIDTSFVENINVDHHARNLVDSVIDLAHNLNLKTVAEGVETVEQLNYLRGQECDEFQGYYFSKPLDVDDFTALLKEGRRLELPDLE